MKLLKTLGESFPYYLNDDRKNTLLVAGLTLFVMGFLLVFHPMLMEHAKKIGLVGIVVFSVMFINIVLLPKLFPTLLDPLNWTIGKYLLFTLIQCLQIGIVGPIVTKSFGYHPEWTLLEAIFSFYKKIVIYGSVSIIIVTIVLRNAMLKANLRNAIRANQELEKMRFLKDPGAVPQASNVITIYSDTTETLKLHLPDLLYIEANDNYSTFYWRNATEIEKRLLRVNLKNVEMQVNNTFIVRCHRSYIVNINAISHVRGNTNGYKLSFPDTPLAVPVSRSKGQEVIEKIAQIRNLAEFNS